MTEEQRAREIQEIRKLVDEMEALAHYQIAKALCARSLLARLGASEQDGRASIPGALEGHRGRQARGKG